MITLKAKRPRKNAVKTGIILKTRVDLKFFVVMAIPTTRWYKAKTNKE